MSINERLKLVCQEKELNIKGLAEITGIPYRTVQNYLNGDREPNAEGLTTLCTRLGVNINWLLTGEGEHFINSNPRVVTIDDDEHTILSIYRDCSQMGRFVILQSIKSMKDVPVLHDNNLVIKPLSL